MEGCPSKEATTLSIHLLRLASPASLLPALRHTRKHLPLRPNPRLTACQLPACLDGCQVASQQLWIRPLRLQEERQTHALLLLLRLMLLLLQMLLVPASGCACASPACHPLRVSFLLLSAPQCVPVMRRELVELRRNLPLQLELLQHPGLLHRRHMLLLLLLLLLLLVVVRMVPLLEPLLWSLN